MWFKKKNMSERILENENKSLRLRIQALEREVKVKDSQIKLLYDTKKEYDKLIDEVKRLKARMNNQMNEIDLIKDAYEKELKEITK